MRLPSGSGKPGTGTSPEYPLRDSVGIRTQDPVSYTHLDVYKRQVHYEGEAVELLALRGHLLGKYRPDNNLHFHDSPKLTFR